MSDPIKSGMYSGTGTIKVEARTVKRDRTIFLLDGSGELVEVPSLPFLYDLERQLSKSQADNATLTATVRQQQAQLKRLETAVRKLDSRSRD